jgi:hypothetical protein
MTVTLDPAPPGPPDELFEQPLIRAIAVARAHLGFWVSATGEN